MPVFFEDTNAPVSIEISMNFQETELLSKESIAESPYEVPPPSGVGIITSPEENNVIVNDPTKGYGGA